MDYDLKVMSTSEIYKPYLSQVDFDHGIFITAIET